MAEYDELLSQAKVLGEQILKQPRVAAFFDAVRKMEADATAHGLLTDYQTKMDALHQKQMEGKPIEVADKRALSDVEGKIAAHPLIKDYMRTQADYVEMMDKIRAAMEAPLAAAAGGPSGVGS